MTVLSKIHCEDEPSKRIFTDEEISTIISSATSPEVKDQLSANTTKVLELGAFGAPWFWVKNRKGIEEPFFGSDRWHFMWQFLEIGWQDIAIIPASGKAKL
jgi:glutathione S-transferase kappa 1